MYEHVGEPGREGEGQPIALGLGDFVFYSVLVSRAALFSPVAGFAALVAVLVGLTATLALLEQRGDALPALPCSILLGTLSFAAIRFGLQPMLDNLSVPVAL